MFKNKFLSVAMGALAIFASIASYAQSNRVTGKVVDASNGEALVGANVVVQGTTIGTVADGNGEFSFSAPANNFTVLVSFIGYTQMEVVHNMSDNGSSMGTIKLSSGASSLSTVEVIASRTTEDKPFTYADVTKRDLQVNLGSRDLPNVLNLTPSVYSTNQGGGAGDSRLNIRGFDQRNIGVMINGIPVNDMENGWVFWSNWDGLGDAAASIQVQKGMSPVNLSVPTVGGTVNIITDPASQSAGGMIKSEMGSWGFVKNTIVANSGLIDNKFAMTAMLSRKTGDGFYNGLFTDAMAYYVGASYQIDDNNKLEISAVGAPQRHGQNLYMQNIARYSHEFAASLEGYDLAALDQYREAGRDFNQNYGGVSSTYQGRQYYEMYRRNFTRRYDDSYIMERENYYHKPQVNLNWYHAFSDNLRWNNVVYWSGGNGGGSGTYGSVSTDYSYSGMGIIQWDDEIAQNSNNVDSMYSTSMNRSTGILRNSINQQNTYGAISKLFYDVGNWNFQVGLDYRTAEIAHWREVRDLLGGDYYVFSGNDFDETDASHMKGLGDKVAYDNTNEVNWFSGFGQAEYTSERLNLFGMVGYTTVKYLYTDFFTKADDGGYLTIETENLPGYQLKLGGAYDVTENFRIYANGGYISRNPIFDYAINDGAGVAYDNPENEKIQTIEIGGNYNIGNKIVLSANYYNTAWADRTITRSIRTETGDEDFLFIGGLGQNHSGIEFNAAVQPSRVLRVDLGASFGDWTYAGDVNATYTTYEDGSPVEQQLNLYLDGLMVGDAPMNQLMASVTLNPFNGLSLKADYRSYSKFYSNFSALDRTDEADAGVQSWQIPNYAVLDLHATYDLPMKANGFSIQFFAHVFNALDEVYIQDALDNSRYNSFDDDHDADDAEIFLGLPRNFNIGVAVRF